MHLEGKISVDSLASPIPNEFWKQHIPSFDPSRFSIVAIRIFSGDEFIVTVYAEDKLAHKASETDLMVKKFKTTTISPGALFSYVKSWNLTLVFPGNDLEKMDVINR
jgi:hypothetical protein